LAGDYRGRDAVYGMFGKLMEITGGTFRLDVHTILADDDHGVALVVATGSRNGQSVELKEAHVFHLLNGKVVEFWEAFTDQYSADELLA
jgi:ketosteroid isomerase-like protein